MKKMLFVFGLLAACTHAPDKAEQKQTLKNHAEKVRRDSIIEKNRIRQEALRKEQDSLLKKKEELLRR